jgi:hypothetical protein
LVCDASQSFALQRGKEIFCFAKELTSEKEKCKAPKEKKTLNLTMNNLFCDLT